jgi:hypothetical protein
MVWKVKREEEGRDYEYERQVDCFDLVYQVAINESSVDSEFNHSDIHHVS